jgi:hypothetical protein
VPDLDRRAPAIRRGAAALAALAACLAAPAASGSAAPPAKPYTTEPSAYRAHARFVVTYKGTGDWKTDFHATPPNPGGDPDTNDAHDSSTQNWQLRFRRQFVLPPCGAPAGGGPDPCAGVGGLDGAGGATSAVGRIDHTHVDGLYRELDRKVKCQVGKDTEPGRRLDASLRVRYFGSSRAIAVTALNPVVTLLTEMPTACPDQGDSIDRILDNYFSPGFSFDSRYDAYRWFTSRTIVIPASVVHRSSVIRIPLADTPRGTPPKGCAVQNPAYERCTTGGSWSGVLTLRAPKP